MRMPIDRGRLRIGRRGFWAAVVLLHLAYAGVQLAHERYELGDSREYLAVADNLRLRGTAYAGNLDAPRDPALYTKRPPGYPLLLAAVRAAAPSHAAVMLVQTALSLFTLALVLRLLRHLGVPPPYGVLLAVLALTPSQFIYAALVMSEIAVQACATGAFYLFARFLQTRDGRRLAGAGVLLGLAAWVKPVFYPLALPYALVAAWLAWRARRPAWAGLGLIPLAAVLALVGWNAARTGVPQVSSIQDVNLLHYNAYLTLAAAEGPAAAEAAVDAAAARAAEAPTYAARRAAAQAEALAILQAHAGTYATLHLRGMAAFFVDPGRFDLVHFFGLSQEGPGLLRRFSAEGVAGVARYLAAQRPWFVLVLGLVALANLFELGCLAVFAGDRRVPLGVRLSLVALVLYVAALTGPLGAARFALPVVPLLLVAVGVAAARRRAPVGAGSAARS